MSNAGAIFEYDSLLINIIIFFLKRLKDSDYFCSNMFIIIVSRLSRFEKTNEMLINFNILSANRFEATVKDFQKHTQLLFDMKKDLDTVFKRIRYFYNFFF